jgi:hypothetical protein
MPFKIHLSFEAKARTSQRFPNIDRPFYLRVKTVILDGYCCYPREPKPTSVAGLIRAEEQTPQTTQVQNGTRRHQRAKTTGIYLASEVVFKETKLPMQSGKGVGKLAKGTRLNSRAPGFREASAPIAGGNASSCNSSKQQLARIGGKCAQEVHSGLIHNQKSEGDETGRLFPLFPLVQTDVSLQTEIAQVPTTLLSWSRSPYALTESSPQACVSVETVVGCFEGSLDKPRSFCSKRSQSRKF